MNRIQRPNENGRYLLEASSQDHLEFSLDLRGEFDHANVTSRRILDQAQ